MTIMVSKKEISYMNYIVNTIVIVASLFGLVIIFFLSFRFFNAEDYRIQTEFIYLGVVLLAMGPLYYLLNGVIKQVLVKAFNDYLRKKAGKEFLGEQIKVILENEDFVQSGIEKSPAFAKMFREVAGSEEQVGADEVLNFDTVIVPAGNTLDWVEKNKYYICQKNRTFAEVKYIAFYKEKEIHRVAEWTKLQKKDLVVKIENEDFIKEYLEKYKHSSIHDLDVYELKNDRKLEIKHNKPYALVQRQIYTNMNSLLTAKTTDTIARQTKPS